MKPVEGTSLEVLVDRAIRKKESSTLLDVAVSTGSKNTGLTGYDTWRKRLLLSVRERPVDGGANASIIGFFSGLVGIPSTAVRIVSGQRSSKKTIEVAADIQKVKQAVLSALEPR